ncbi:hypothetical protein [Sphingobacterium sp. LRF_L2]|uniref:hypothetical protein n=1 Tax=Sphingobacterium sp. LRF_L2 TaxID=3369421 RepID=UPI003F6478D5
MNIDEARNIIIDAIENDTKHPNYKRVNELRKLYTALVTGQGIEDFLLQFQLREDKAAFDQRVKLTVSTTDAICSTLINPFEKVLRTDPLVKRIESRDELALDILTDKIMQFYSSENQNSGLDYWLQTRFKSLTFLDPNAFVVLEWDAFDHNHARATPYPYEVSCEQAINFKYKNNKLQFLLDRKQIEYKEDDLKKKGYKFTLYGIGFVLVFERVPDKYIVQANEEIWSSGKSGNRYAVRYHETLLDVATATAIGYVGDQRTNEATYVNPFHSAVSWFKKILRRISEADLSQTQHAFPQKFQYVQPCPGVPNDPCRAGLNTEGGTCESCRGSGYIFHTSAQDAIVMPLPKHADDMVDLDKLMVYKHPPIDLLKFQEDIIDKYEQKIHAAVFNTLSLIKKTTVATATERDQDMDNVYDTLNPFAEKIMALWSSTVQNVAEIVEANPEDLIIDIRYPSDFKLKTIAQLVGDLKEANESNAPSFMRAKLSADLAEQTFVDQPEEFAKYQIKERMFPFPGKTSDEIDTLIFSDLVPFRTKVLYANFDSLFLQAEKEHIGFWTMNADQQEGIIMGYRDLLVKELTPAQPTFNALS